LDEFGGRPRVFFDCFGTRFAFTTIRL